MITKEGVDHLMKFEVGINIRIDAAEGLIVEADSKEEAVTKAKEQLMAKYEDEIAKTAVCMEYMEGSEDYCLKKT